MQTVPSNLVIMYC